MQVFKAITIYRFVFLASRDSKGDVNIKKYFVENDVEITKYVAKDIQLKEITYNSAMLLENIAKSRWETHLPCSDCKKYNISQEWPNRKWIGIDYSIWPQH